MKSFICEKGIAERSSSAKNAIEGAKPSTKAPGASKEEIRFLSRRKGDKKTPFAKQNVLVGASLNKNTDCTEFSPIYHRKMESRFRTFLPCACMKCHNSWEKIKQMEC